MDIKKNGETIFNAAAVMVKTGEEINSMLEKLYKLLSKEIKTVEDVNKIQEGSDDEIAEPDDSNWVSTGYIIHYDIYRTGRGRSKPSAYLAIQIKLCDKAECEIVGPQPLLYVLFATGEWDIDEFLVSNALSEGFRPEENGFLWKRYEDGESKGEQQEWYNFPDCAFVLPLVAINTPNDLKTLIAEPVKQIMSNTLDPKKIDKRILRFKDEGNRVSLT